MANEHKVSRPASEEGGTESEGTGTGNAPKKSGQAPTGNRADVAPGAEPQKKKKEDTGSGSGTGTGTAP